MKKDLFKVVLIICIVTGSAGQSWAFASRHHHNHGTNSGTNFQNQGLGQNGNNSNGNNSDVNNSNGNNPNGNDPNSNWVNPQGNNFPAAPIPEPMTLSLLATGLAGVILKKRMP